MTLNERIRQIYDRLVEMQDEALVANIEGQLLPASDTDAAARRERFQRVWEEIGKPPYAPDDPEFRKQAQENLEHFRNVTQHHPEFLKEPQAVQESIAQSKEDLAAGRYHTHEQVMAHFEKFKKRLRDA